MTGMKSAWLFPTSIMSTYGKQPDWYTALHLAGTIPLITGKDCLRLNAHGRRTHCAIFFITPRGGQQKQWLCRIEIGSRVQHVLPMWIRSCVYLILLLERGGVLSYTFHRLNSAKFALISRDKRATLDGRERTPGETLRTARIKLSSDGVLL